MNTPLIFLSTCTLLAVSAPAYAQKPLAAPSLEQAKKLLPSIGIELDPGDGGEVASTGKLYFENFLPLHVKLALAQKQMGDTAGAQVTLARARALCTDKKGTYQGLVTLLVNEGLRAGFYAESVAFHNKHDIDGFRAPLLAEYELTVRKDVKAATAVLLVGIARGKTLETKGKALEKGSDDQWTRLTTLFNALDCAVRHNLPDAATAARAAFAPYLQRDGGEVASAGKWDEAEKLYTRAIALNPKEPTAYLDRGRVRGERKRFALAIDDATVALTLLGLARDSTPRAVSAAYASRASYWLGLGEPRRALIDAIVATEADPDFSGARLGKADAYYALGELDEAKLQLIQAQVLDFKIKRSYTASGAEKNARKNGRLDGKRDTDPLFQAATRAQQEGKLKEAIEGYTAVLTLDPGIANAWWNRALAQLKTGNLAAALADSSTYVALAGRNSDKTDHAKALRFRASVYTRLSRYREAVSDLEWAVKLKPDEPKNAAQLKTARETLAAQPPGAPSPQER